MLYADVFGIAPRSQLSLAETMTAAFEIYAAFVAKKKTVAICIRSPSMKTDMVEEEAKG